MSNVKKEKDITDTPEVTENPEITPEDMKKAPEVETTNPEAFISKIGAHLFNKSSNTPEVVTPDLKEDFVIRIDGKVSSGVWTEDDGIKAKKLFMSTQKSLSTRRNASLRVSSGVSHLLKEPTYVNGLYETPEELVELAFNLRIGFGDLANLDNSGNCIFNEDKDFQKLVLDGYPTNRAKELYLKRKKLEEKDAIIRTPFGIELRDKTLQNAKNLGEFKASIRNILNPKSGSSNNSLSSHDIWNSCKSIAGKMGSFIDRSSELNLTDDNKNAEIIEFIDDIMELAPQLRKLVSDNK